VADRYEITARVILMQGPCVLCAGKGSEDFAVLPGGHVDGGDAHTLEAVRREVYEEIGVPLSQVRKLTVLPALWSRNGDLVHETLHLYAAATTVPLLGGALPRSPEPGTLLRWVSVDDLTYGRVHLQPYSVLPWVIRCARR
jgi:8-oxo-dGTP pyrophosphatase MutT (NUDIX family)